MKGVWGKKRSPRSRGKIKGEIPLKERGADRDRATVQPVFNRLDERGVGKETFPLPAVFPLRRPSFNSFFKKVSYPSTVSFSQSDLKFLFLTRERLNKRLKIMDEGKRDF